MVIASYIDVAGREAAAEEHVEDLLRGYVTFVLLVGRKVIPLMAVISRANLIIGTIEIVTPSLFGITQDRKSGAN